MALDKQDVPAASGLLVGSRQLLITTGSGNKTYIAENWSPSQPATIITSMDELGKERAAGGIKQPATGTATLLFPLLTADQLTDLLFREFQTNLHQEDAPLSTTFWITEVGIPESSGQEKKMSINWRKKIN